MLLPVPCAGHKLNKVKRNKGKGPEKMMLNTEPSILRRQKLLAI